MGLSSSHNIFVQSIYNIFLDGTQTQGFIHMNTHLVFTHGYLEPSEFLPPQ